MVSHLTPKVQDLNASTVPRSIRSFEWKLHTVNPESEKSPFSILAPKFRGKIFFENSLGRFKLHWQNPENGFPGLKNIQKRSYEWQKI